MNNFLRQLFNAGVQMEAPRAGLLDPAEEFRRAEQDLLEAMEEQRQQRIRVDVGNEVPVRPVPLRPPEFEMVEANPVSTLR